MGDTPTTIPAASDPTLYDDFDAPAFDGAWNTALWQATFDPNDARAEQKEGILIITGQSAGGNGLNAIRPDERKIDEIGLVEANMMLGSHLEASRGEAGFVIGGLTSGEWWYMGCNISGGGG